MPMQWDSVLVRAAAEELEERLEGARLRSFHLDYGARRAVVYFRKGTLVWRLHPERGDVTLLPAEDPPAEARPLASTLVSVSVRPDDRVLRMAFRRLRGRRPGLELVLELMTNQWNALAVEQGTGILRHALRTRDKGRRPLRVGTPYVAPPASDRLGARASVDLATWKDRLDGVERDRLAGTVLRTFAYTSRLNVAAILEHEDAGQPDLATAYAVWRELRDGDRTAPCILETSHGLQPYPVPLQGLASTATRDLLTAFEQASAALDRETGAPATLLPSSLLDGIESAVASARRRLEQLEREERRTPDPAAVRAVADLLLARMHRVPAGAETVALEGFDGQPVEVELDPRKTVAENAEDRYGRAQRAERALEKLPALQAEAADRLAHLEGLLERARAGDADESELRPFARAPEGTTTGTDQAPSLPYRRYRSSGGLEIRVGRGARSNDDLTFHHSAPDDVWLHARHTAGAHVILRWPGPGNPPARDLREAAVLAALHSRARTSGSVPVDWTRRKYVRKPRKAPPGRVTIEREETLFVGPDPELLEALADE